MNYNLHKNDEKNSSEFNQNPKNIPDEVIENFNDTVSKEFYYEAESDDYRVNAVRKLNFNDTGLRNEPSPEYNNLCNHEEAKLSGSDSKENFLYDDSNLKNIENQQFTRTGSTNASKQRSRDLLKKFGQNINRSNENFLKSSNKNVKNGNDLKNSLEFIKKEVSRELFCTRCNHRNRSYWDRRKEGLSKIETDIDARSLSKTYSQPNIPKKNKRHERSIEYKYFNNNQKEKRDDLAIIDTNLPISPMKIRNTEGNYVFYNDKNARNYYKTPNNENVLKSPYRKTRKIVNYQAKENIVKNNINKSFDTNERKNTRQKKTHNEKNVYPEKKKYSSKENKSVNASPFRVDHKQSVKEKTEPKLNSVYSRNLEQH